MNVYICCAPSGGKGYASFIYKYVEYPWITLLFVKTYIVITSKISILCET